MITLNEYFGDKEYSDAQAFAAAELLRKVNGLKESKTDETRT